MKEFKQPSNDYFKNFTAYDIFTHKPVKINLLKVLENSKNFRLPSTNELKAIKTL